MIGQHEAALILACRAAEHGGWVISEDTARSIAALWHSPNRRDQGITALSHSGKRLPSLRSEVEREIQRMAKWQSSSDAVSRLELRSLLNWIIANPIEVIRYEHVIFIDGDAADEILQMIYPDWAPGGGSTGWPDGAQDAMAYMRGGDCGEATDQPDSYERPNASYGSEMFEDDDHAMAWHFGLGWVSLSRKVKEVG